MPQHWSKKVLFLPYLFSETPQKNQGWVQGLVKGVILCFRNLYFYFWHGESTSTASQLTSPASQKSKDLNKVPLLLQNLGWVFVCVGWLSKNLGKPWAYQFWSWRVSKRVQLFWRQFQKCKFRVISLRIMSMIQCLFFRLYNLILFVSELKIVSRFECLHAERVDFFLGSLSSQFDTRNHRCYHHPHWFI